MYSNGDGVKKNDAEALRWIRRAADHGFGNAQNELGVLYEHGRGVQQDYAEAYFWESLKPAMSNSGGYGGVEAVKHLTAEQKAAIGKRLKKRKPIRPCSRY